MQAYPSEQSIQTLVALAMSDAELRLELSVSPHVALKRHASRFAPQDLTQMCAYSEHIATWARRLPSSFGPTATTVTLQAQAAGPWSLGPERIEGVIPTTLPLSSHYLATTIAAPIQASGEFDIEIFRENDGARIFGANVSRDAFGTKLPFDDALFLPVDLGITPFTPLSVSGTQPGVRIFARDPFLTQTTVNTFPSAATPSVPITFTTDAELAIFTRNPSELRETLVADGPFDWLPDLSTLRGAPLGELALNERPFEIPAVVSLPLRADTDYASIAPLLAHYFSFTGGTNAQPIASWGNAAKEPQGTGSIKALRFIQFGPCDNKQDLQPLLNGAKVGLMELFNACGQGMAGANLNDLRVEAFNLIPYITRASELQTLQQALDNQTRSGMLLHGRIVFDLGLPGLATSPALVDFVVDYGIGLQNGLLTIDTRLLSYELSGGSGYVSNLVDALIRTGLTVPFGDRKPSLIFESIPGKIASKAATGQLFDFSTRGLGLFFGSGLNCHQTDGSSMDCSKAAAQLEIFVLNGVDAFFGPDALSQAQLENIHTTIFHGADQPDKSGNWFCEPDTDGEDPQIRQHKGCQFVARARRALLHLDQINVTPFFDFTDFDNPALMLFFLLFGLGGWDGENPPSVGGLIKGQQFFQLLCDRFPVDSLPQPLSGVDFFNRWYASVNVANTTCANHSPALLVKSCKIDSDCSDSSMCTNGRCELRVLDCATDANCYPWESCRVPLFSPLGAKKQCVRVFGSNNPFGQSCSGDWDPFAPAGSSLGACPVGWFCDGGECRRL